MSLAEPPYGVYVDPESVFAAAASARVLAAVALEAAARVRAVLARSTDGWQGEAATALRASVAAAAQVLEVTAEQVGRGSDVLQQLGFSYEEALVAVAAANGADSDAQAAHKAATAAARQELDDAMAAAANAADPAAAEEAAREQYEAALRSAGDDVLDATGLTSRGMGQLDEELTTATLDAAVGLTANSPFRGSAAGSGAGSGRVSLQHVAATADGLEGEAEPKLADTDGLFAGLDAGLAAELRTVAVAVDAQVATGAMTLDVGRATVEAVQATVLAGRVAAAAHLGEHLDPAPAREPAGRTAAGPDHSVAAASVLPLLAGLPAGLALGSAGGDGIVGGGFAAENGGGNTFGADGQVLQTLVLAPVTGDVERAVLAGDAVYATVDGARTLVGWVA